MTCHEPRGERSLTGRLHGGLVFLLSLALGGMATAQAGEQKTDAELLASFNTKSGVVYKTVGNRKLELLFFLPRERPAGKMPVMLYTHGGGWGGGNVYKIFKPAFLDTLRLILDEGIACVAVKYRLAKEGQSTAVECAQDCKDAARFLVKNAEQFGIDPDRLGVWGGSAGGHLSLMTALADNALFQESEELARHDPQFRCVVSYYPLTSFLRTELFEGSVFGDPDKMVKLLGGLAKDRQDVAALLSPVRHLKGNSPPVLLIHGDRDTVLPISQSELFLKVAKEKEAVASLITVTGARHSLGGKSIAPSMRQVNELAAEFMVKHLKGRPECK